jgi:hypothetical protein
MVREVVSMRGGWCGGTGAHCPEHTCLVYRAHTGKPSHRRPPPHSTPPQFQTPPRETPTTHHSIKFWACVSSRSNSSGCSMSFRSRFTP